jgi:pre-mRNA-splicing factor SYF1
MPRIWLEYGEFLTTQKKISLTRHVFDRALRSLPITQHDRIWKLYTKFASSPFVPFETSAKIWNRYFKVEPDKVEEYAEYLIATEQWNEAAVQLIKIVNNANFTSRNNISKHDHWMSLCDIIAKYSEKLHNNAIDVDKIVRGGLKQFSEDTGKLWTTLAGYYIRQSYFDKVYIYILNIKCIDHINYRLEIYLKRVWIVLLL